MTNVGHAATAELVSVSAAPAPGRMRRPLGFAAVSLALLSALVTFVVLAGLTPIVPAHEVVVSLLSMDEGKRVRVRAQVPEHEPTLPTLFELFPGTEAMEREVYDMFGIVFEGHPDLTRILMPDDWEGHPLRKDYSVGQIPVQFKGAPPPR